MERMEVKRTTFNLGGFEMNGYSAGEIDPVTGGFVNYLSSRQLAESIGNNHSTVVHSRMSEELKTLLDGDFPRGAFFQSEVGGMDININLWTTQQAGIYYAYHAKKGNQKAFEIVLGLMSTTLDIIINDSFGRSYNAGDAQAMVNARIYEMRLWVRENYDYRNTNLFLNLNDVVRAGFSRDEASYMANEAYLQTKGDEAVKILKTKKPKYRKLELVQPLANSIQTGLEFRGQYEAKLGIIGSKNDYYQGILTQVNDLHPKRKKKKVS